MEDRRGELSRGLDVLRGADDSREGDTVLPTAEPGVFAALLGCSVLDGTFHEFGTARPVRGAETGVTVPATVGASFLCVYYQWMWIV